MPVLTRSAIPLLATLLLAACGTAERAPADVSTRVTDSAGVRMQALPANDAPFPEALEEVARIAPTESGPGAFGALYAGNVTTNGADRIYVLNDEESVIAVLDEAGTPLTSVGRRGGGPGEIGMGADLSVEPDGTLAVYDYTRSAYVRFDTAGGAMPLRQLPRDTAWSPDAEARALPNGFVFAARRLQNDSLTRGLRLVSGTDTSMLVTQTIAVTMDVAFGSCPVRMRGLPPYFATEFAFEPAPTGIAVMRSNAWRVEWYRDGQLAEVWSRSLPERAASLDILAREAGKGLTIRFNDQSCTTPLAEAAKARGMAPTIPALRRIAVAPDGTLWAERWEPVDDTQRVDVIASDGRYLGTISGRGAPLGFLRGGRVLYAETDTVTDVQSLVVLRLRGANW
jgi:hypothetical protein